MVGRPCKTWEQVIKEDLHVKGLGSKAAQNRAEWRPAIAYTVQPMLA